MSAVESYLLVARSSPFVRDWPASASHLTNRPKLLFVRPAYRPQTIVPPSHCAPIRPQSGASGSARRESMASPEIAAAMRRFESVLKRRPEVGLHDDALATARWESGTRVVSSHANGIHLSTDMPTELGGSGDQVTPGWLFRAGLASCLATRIAMGAAAAGFELAMLEVLASSRSDARGMLGM